MHTKPLLLTAMAAVLALPHAALAQRASENAVANADDAFGSNVGLETTGIYSDSDTRGFSPVKAGNARIDGIYYDPVGSLSGRLRQATAIRVGFASEEFPFHAPTGIADYRFRPFPDKAGASLSHSTMAFGGYIDELDLRIPIIDGKSALTGGIARADLRMSDGSTNASWGYAFRPYFRFGETEISAWTSGAHFYRNYSRPLTVVRGDKLPALPPKRRYLGQKWANGDYHNSHLGVMAKAKLADGLSLRAGLFRAAGPRTENYAEVFSYTAPDQPLSHRLISDPEQDIHSTSGEALLAWKLGSADRQHRFFIGYRGRDRYTETGGSAVVSLAAVDGWNVIQQEKPDFRYGKVNAGRVRQASWMAGYTGKLAGIGSLNLGAQKVRYRASFRNGATGAQSRTSESAWLYNSTANIVLNKHFSIYGGSERGLEDSGVAPDNANNAREQLPAALTTQYEGGVRWKFKGGQLVVSGFQITKPYFSFDPAGDFVAVGKVRHRGIETSLSGHIGKRLNVVAGALFLQPRVTGAARAAGDVGARPTGTPSAYARFDVNYRTSLLGGLTPTASMIYTGKRAVSAKPLASLDGRQLMLGGFATVDLGLRQQFKVGKIPASFRAVVHNVFDKAEWKVIAPNTIYPDERRRITISLTADF